jgi:nondiscriminating aspartyl-tRNA synthetase
MLEAMVMERTYIKNLQLGHACRIQGFVENIRNTRAMMFLVIRDITGKVQITIEKNAHQELADILEHLTVESVITVEGAVQLNPAVKLGGVEVLPAGICVESLAEPLPLLKDSSLDVRMDYRWLNLRGERERLLFRVQTLLTESMRGFLLKQDFLEIHTPKLIAMASESGSEVFEVKYFDDKAYLAQSPQFYKQMAMAAGFERVFEVGPVFRAEKSYTNRHATEFTGFDLELSYITSYEDVMRLEEALLKDALRNVKEAYGEDIERLYGIEVTVPSLPFPVIALHDLYDELEKRYGYAVPESEKGDTTTEAEQLAYRYVKEVYGHEFLFVKDFSFEKRAFYHMRKNGVPQGYDLLWRGVEITTGAQREHRYDLLLKQAEEKGLGDDVKSYTAFFRYGCPPHGGFGLGLDRLTMLLMNTTIKEAMFLFRGPNRITP